ncbi:reverse transcriptase domain-containing protein [Tanacetum coccineum]
MGISNLQTHVDSRLVANKLNGSYIAKESGMIQYLKKVKTFASGFKKFSIKQVPRSENKKADALKVLTVVEEELNTWMTPIYEYLTKETLSAKKKKARMVRLKSRRYAVINGVIYKKSFLEPWLQCVRPLQANYVMREIHEGSCSMHVGPRSMVATNRLGLPGEIISDNGKQFRDNPFKDWCEKLSIRQRFASVKHPQANGLVERANRSLGEGMKA